MKIIKLIYCFLALLFFAACSNKNIIIQDKIKLNNNISNSLTDRRIPLYNSKYINQAKKNLANSNFFPSHEDMEFVDIKSLYKESYYQLLIEDSEESNKNTYHSREDLLYKNKLLMSKISELEKEIHKIHTSTNKNLKNIPKSSNIILNTKKTNLATKNGNKEIKSQIKNQKSEYPNTVKSNTTKNNLKKTIQDSRKKILSTSKNLYQKQFDSFIQNKTIAAKKLNHSSTHNTQNKKLNTNYKKDKKSNVQLRANKQSNNQKNQNIAKPQHKNK